MFKKKSTDSPRARVFESRDHLDTQTILKKFNELFRKYKMIFYTIFLRGSRKRVMKILIPKI
jgi:hypothetical protein